MGENTKIEWADHTFNPWWGCEKVSPACKNCYAAEVAVRFRPDLKLWGPDSSRKPMSDKYWETPLRWSYEARKAGERRRVFCASMADVMEDRPDLWAKRARLYRLIENTPNLDWMLLTKRPENFRLFLPENWLAAPRANVWGMTTVESQAQAWRAVELMRTPFRVRGLSCEPLLGALDLRRIEYNPGGSGGAIFADVLSGKFLSLLGGGEMCRLDFVIAGGESGLQARPSSPHAIRALRDQCIEAGTKFFFKQWGGWAPAEEHDYSDGVRLIDSSGRDVTDEAGQYDPAKISPMARMPKAVAGRLLDGREWNDLPVSSPGGVA